VCVWQSQRQLQVEAPAAFWVALILCVVVGVCLGSWLWVGGGVGHSLSVGSGVCFNFFFLSFFFIFVVCGVCGSV